jgi:transposase
LCKVLICARFTTGSRRATRLPDPATDPQVVLAVWLYATLKGIGSARAIDRLCQQHAAYRWLCGGAPINHDLLASFRREHAALLDRLLSQSVTGLIAEKLVSLEEMAIKPAPAQVFCPGRLA